MTKRTLCLDCQRPENACICKFISPVENNIHVVILQHPSEISQTKGTVALLAKSLGSCQVIIGENFTGNMQLQQVLIQHEGLLLYPSENAQELSEGVNNLKKHKDLNVVDGCNQIIKSIKPPCLIILDGTWKKAYKMFMLCKTLQQLKQVCLPLSLANSGQYHIRKVAKKNALSSLEACCYALSLFENSEKYQKLFTAFDDFNKYQLSFRPKHHLSTEQTQYLGKN